MASEYTYDEEGDTWPYFILAVLTFVLIPLTITWVYRVLNANNPLMYNEKIKGSVRETPSTLHVENEDRIKDFQRKQRSARIFNKTFLLLIVGWGVVIYISLYLIKEADLQGTFDPYTILDVSTFASEREIKSRYRKLSLKFHPDKLPKDLTEKAREEMEAAFIKIGLAYKALTDEPTRQNFLKYGHPDGPQDVSHGIAIPKFLVEGKYSPIMIVFYFLLIGAFLPYVVGSWWSNVKSHTKKGLHVETAALFTKKLVDRNPAVLLMPYDILDWICLSKEIREEFKHLDYNVVRDFLVKHMFRDYEYAHTNTNMEADKLKLISLLPDLINGLIDIAVIFRQTDVVLTAAELQKSIIQGVKPTGKHQELLQLPYVDAGVVEKQPVKKLGKLFTMDEETQKKVLGIKDSGKLKKAIEIAARIPFIRVLDASFKVPGEEVVPPGANAHLVVKFLVKSPKLKSAPQIDEEKLVEEESLEYLRDPLKSNEEQPRLPYSYSACFPSNILNSWTGFLISQKDNKLVEGSEAYTMSNVDLSNIELSQDKWISGDVVISTFKLPLAASTPNEVGNYHFRLVLKNTAYFGSDIDIPVTMKVETPKFKDIQLKKNTVESDTDDSDISDPEEDSLAGALAALRGETVKKATTDDEELPESDTESIITDINTDTEDEAEK